jgi:hypothetical protein
MHFCGENESHPDRFTVPVELVPPDISALVDRHYLPPFFAACCPLPLGRPPFCAIIAPHTSINDEGVITGACDLASGVQVGWVCFP